MIDWLSGGCFVTISKIRVISLKNHSDHGALVIKVLENNGIFTLIKSFFNVQPIIVSFIIWSPFWDKYVILSTADWNKGTYFAKFEFYFLGF